MGHVFLGNPLPEFEVVVVSFVGGVENFTNGMCKVDTLPEGIIFYHHDAVAFVISVFLIFFFLVTIVAKTIVQTYAAFPIQSFLTFFAYNTFKRSIFCIWFWFSTLRVDFCWKLVFERLCHFYSFRA